MSILTERGEAELKRFGWKLGPKFEERYLTDAWVFNLANAVETVARERDVALEKLSRFEQVGEVEICDICTLPFAPGDIHRGHGDGTGQRFAHNDCYWRERAERTQAEVTRLREQLDEARGLVRRRVVADEVDGTALVTWLFDGRSFLARSEVQP